MVRVRAMLPVRGVVHEQTASPFGWKELQPERN
jgi:hypothetical protein